MSQHSGGLSFRRSLRSKKSLPDLRKNHDDILRERWAELTQQLSASSSNQISALPSLTSLSSIQSTQSLPQQAQLGQYDAASLDHQQQSTRHPPLPSSSAALAAGTSSEGASQRSTTNVATTSAISGAMPLPSSSASSSSLTSQPLARRPVPSARRPPRANMGGVPMQLSGSSPAGSGLASTPNAAGIGAGGGGGGGLRKLSLPTVGATQAAAEAAAAALAARSNNSNSNSSSVSSTSNTPPRYEVGHLAYNVHAGHAAHLAHLGHGRMPSDRGESNWPSRSASPTIVTVRNPADQERNSYFRRLSTLPASTISKAVPTPVLKFVDGTRGVLFALSQIHAAIGQFMTPVMDDRISGQFHRVLDISNGSITALINSLDRFDSLSRRGAPEPSVIRGVLTTCRESVLTFRKLVSVLQLQLRALQNNTDVRYARTLLLMLCGSLAEVSNSWNDMAPLVEAVQPYLTQQDAALGTLANGDTVSVGAIGTSAPMPSHPTARSGSIGMKSASGTSSTPTLHSIAEAVTPVRPGTRSYVARGPSRRRHAGSFSAQDLAQGAAMAPSAGNPPPFNLEDLQAASAYNTPARPTRVRTQGSGGASAGGTWSRSDSIPSDAEGNLANAPSTPASATAASRAAAYHTPGTSTPSRQKRSGSNASSAAAVGGDGATAPLSTPRSQAGTPASRSAANRHRVSLSLSNGPAMPGSAAAARLNMAVAESKVAVDEHLLSMLDRITRLSSQVWSMLFEHLQSLGINSESVATLADLPTDDEAAMAAKSGPTTGGHSRSSSIGNGNGSGASVSVKRLHDLREQAQNTDELTSQLRSTYLRAREEEEHMHGDGLLGHRRTDSGSSGANVIPHNTNGVDVGRVTGSPLALASTGLDRPVAMTTSSSGGPHPPHPSSSSSLSKFSGNGSDSKTDKISQTTVLRLFQESHLFVRAIVNTSTLMKNISESHEFPRDLRRALGEVAQACSNLTVYLLWLAPNPATSAS
ncbi:hypothetical protein BCV70DRAFT_58839 [Testicularia cyperi]|uniref:Uncharacterized protein n=1 Tax=Testicularia cyperi TaxID=1882483 RepID=A0A317XVS2_9BASI|nr:hypothetical protein BCV70DRAFT_58839 [Testicularia cyperi]